MAFESFFDYLDDPIDLSDSKDWDFLKAFEITVALRNTAGDDDGFSRFLCFLYQVYKLLLWWVFNCAGVKEASVSIFHVVDNFIPVIS